MMSVCSRMGKKNARNWMKNLLAKDLMTFRPLKASSKSQFINLVVVSSFFFFFFGCMFLCWSSITLDGMTSGFSYFLFGFRFKLCKAILLFSHLLMISPFLLTEEIFHFSVVRPIVPILRKSTFSRTGQGRHWRSMPLYTHHSGWRADEFEFMHIQSSARSSRAHRT